MSVSLIKTVPGTFYNDSTGMRTPMVTPLVMPKGRKVHQVHAVPKMVQHSRCAQGAACTGPGCRVSTGKTARKMG